jgi:hypothetical protein
MARALNIRADVEEPALTMKRSHLWSERLVYIICGNRKLRLDSNGQRYKNGGSRILKIGVTAVGKNRPAGSMALVAERAFWRMRGVKAIHVYLVKCGKRRNVKTWKQLESQLIRTFEKRSGFLPRYNKNRGDKPIGRKLFRNSRLSNLIDELS